MHFQLTIFSVYDGFIGTQPHPKLRKSCISLYPKAINIKILPKRATARTGKQRREAGLNETVKGRAARGPLNSVYKSADHYS